jgi:hypothetical protein
LAGFLNSKLAWFQLCGLAPAVRGGFREARVQFVGALAVPPADQLDLELGSSSALAMKAGEDLEVLNNATLRRLGDIDRRITDSAFFKAWASITFADLQGALIKRFKITIPIAERDEWETWFDNKRAEAAKLAADIVSAEAEINERVYRMFGLTRTEIDAVEDALAIMAPALNVKGFEAISAVEGLQLSGEARERVEHHSSNRSQAHAA